MTLDELVAMLIATGAWSAPARTVVDSSQVVPGAPPRFDDLVFMVRFYDPDADVCAIDVAARPYQRGEPGAYTYEPIA